MMDTTTLEIAVKNLQHEINVINSIDDIICAKFRSEINGMKIFLSAIKNEITEEDFRKLFNLLSGADKSVLTKWCEA